MILSYGRWADEAMEGGSLAAIFCSISTTRITIYSIFYALGRVVGRHLLVPIQDFRITQTFCAMKERNRHHRVLPSVSTREDKEVP